MQIVRRFAAFTDKAQSEALGRQIEQLVNYKAAGEQPDPQLSRWLEQIPAKLKERLVGIGLLDARRAAAKPLAKHLKDFEQSLLASRVQRFLHEMRNKVTESLKNCQL